MCKVKIMAPWLFGPQGTLLWTTEQTLEWSLIVGKVCSPIAGNTDVLPPEHLWCHEWASQQWGPGSCRSAGHMLDLAKIETSFSGESMQSDSGDYPSTEDNSWVVDMEGQGESYILQMRKAGFKVLSWCVDPETRNQAMNWLTPTFSYHTQFNFFLFF